MEVLAQIVCVRKNGKDARTVVAMAPLASQLEAIKGLKKWEGHEKRPHLQLWDDSGARIDPKTGEPVKKPVVKKAESPSPAETPESLNESTPS
jgi:hypothetical protein